MRLQKGQRWQCESRYCGSEFQVVASSEVECGITDAPLLLFVSGDGIISLFQIATNRLPF